MTEREALEALRSSDAEAAAQAEATLWALWSESGSAEIDALFAEGVQAMQKRAWAAAEAVFDRVIAAAPAFAEGWNKRATVRYLQEKYAGSIADCEATLVRNPKHFGALSGQGLCLMALDRHGEAARCFRRALKVHPHMAAGRDNLAVALAEAVKGNGDQEA